MSASFAEAMEMLAFRLDVYDDLEVRTALPSTGWVDVIGTAKADVNSDFAASMNAGYEADREAAAVILDSASVRAGTSPFMSDIAQQVDSVARTDAGVFRDLFDYCHDNAQLVNSREFVMGTPSAAGGNTGDGEIIRLTIDGRGYSMEGWFADSFKATVDADARSLGVNFEEIFLIEGTNAAVDELKRSGTGIEEELVCWSERDTEDFVLNPSFENHGGTAPTTSTPQTPTSLSGWTPTSGATDFSNLQVTIDELWRTPPGSSKSIALEFTDNEKISQDLVAINGTEIQEDVPVAVGVAVYRKDAADGDLTITVGGVSRTIDLESQNDNEWAWYWLVASPGRNNWYNNFRANDLTLSFELSSRITGSMVLDGILFGEMTPIGAAEGVGRGAMGTWAFARSGQTPFVLEDSFSWADSEGGTRGKNQYWLAVGELGYLPSTSAGYEQILDK